MVLYHQPYVRHGAAPQESATIDMASTITKAVLGHFGLNNAHQYRAFLAGTDMYI